MKRPIYVPLEVKAAIRKHVAAAVDKAVEAYDSAQASEDSLTGQLGFALKVSDQEVNIPQGEVPGVWRWSINYKKFSPGRGAAESHLGADGLFEFTVKWASESTTKSLMFQAKKERGNGHLIPQCIKLSTWREAAFVLGYEKDGFYAFDLDDVLRNRTLDGLRGRQLASFITTEYLDCQIGDTDLKYHAGSQLLTWRASTGQRVSTRFSIKHRIQFQVHPPQRGVHDPRYGEIVRMSDVHNFRMLADAEDILKLGPDHSLRQLELAKKVTSRAYHPDRYKALQDRDPLLYELVNRRTQEINDAFDKLKEKMKRRE